MAASDESGSPVFRLIYQSHSRIPKSDRPTVLGEIFSTARSRNKGADITGALLITDHYFAQVLEGPQGTVEELYGRISADPRHERLAVLDSGTVDERAFGKWSMAQVSAAGHADIPLHTANGEIHPAAPSHLTAEQSKVFATMRNAIGADTV
ncbi:FAD-dependent sensor of blue light [Actinomycetospora succinea]|uniref:FAD-dependent sensor of blue light n=1 Tax=Actinomycetospora succinea TaxID=663603 RepID=A0A4V3DBB6_9PSEU|nr:BLUF domain-containing protein [Actinomycetospora succinea]TDQ65898.1 FAD-dependent sensor of blue light [Actinomycetospora succinea]